MSLPGAVGTPVRYLAAEVKALNLDLRERNLLSLSYGRIIRKDIDSSDGLLPAGFDRYTVVEPGDIVLRLTDLQNDQRSLRTGLVKERGIITSAYLTLRPMQGVDARFLAYALHSLDTTKAFYALGGGLRQSMGMEEVGALRIPLADPDEQRRIADFLDEQVHLLDTVRHARESQSRLTLEATRSAIEALVFPAEVLSKPSAPSNATDFADPFGSRVPEGWHATSLRRVLRKRSTPSGGLGRLLSVYLDRGVIPFEEAGMDRVHNPAVDLSAYQLVRPGDFVMNNQQAWRGSVGVSFYEGIVSPAYHVFELAEILHPGWANLALRSYTMTFLYEQVSRGVGSIQRNLDPSGLLALPFRYPELQAQSSVYEQALDLIHQMDALKSDMDSLAVKLDDYKRALITSAVSGLLDVSTTRRGVPQ